MQLFHTASAPITEINESGRFGSFLFFSGNEYVMTAGEHIAYSIEIDDADIIEAGQLFYHEDAAKLELLVARVAAMAGCDDDTAEALIEQRTDVCAIDCNADPCDLGELSWDIQAITAQAAALLGFRAVSMLDEQGTAYMINMKGRESELETV